MNFAPNFKLQNSLRRAYFRTSEPLIEMIGKGLSVTLVENRQATRIALIHFDGGSGMA